MKSSKTFALIKRILKKNSRSFYLTLRFLPQKIRGPISLAYILARIQDTIADTAEIAEEQRLKTLQKMQLWLGNQALETTKEALLEDIAKLLEYQKNQNEKELLADTEFFLTLLEGQEEYVRNQIINLISKIIQGQIWDIEYFSKDFSDEDTIKIVKNNKMLDTYIYLVAGCVGEFWTNITLHYYPKSFIKNNKNDVINYAIEYGKGLQLVNILRDLKKDLHLNRCYLPRNPFVEDAENISNIVKESELFEGDIFKENYEYFKNQAQYYLYKGIMYNAQLKGFRLRFACYLPILIGFRTLYELDYKKVLDSEKPIKISKKNLRQSFMLSILYALNRKLAEKWESYWLAEL